MDAEILKRQMEKQIEKYTRKAKELEKELEQKKLEMVNLEGFISGMIFSTDIVYKEEQNEEMCKEIDNGS